MFYPLTRFPAKILLATYFRQIHFNQPIQIPKDQAVILAANHPTAFLEPCILACWIRRPIYYVVRGDLFSNPIFAKALQVYHMVPFFRMKDGGYTKIRNNFESFDRVFDFLAQKKPVMILAEGSTIHEKRLRPLMKGTARMAFGAMEQRGLKEVIIIPVGVNFTNPNQVRSEAMITFGDPIKTTDFLDEYSANANRGILKLTQELRKRLEPEVLIIQNSERDAVSEFFFEIYRNDHVLSSWPVTIRNDHRLRGHQAIASWLNGKDEAAFDQLKKMVEQYQQALKEHGQTDLGVAQKGKASPAKGFLLAIGVIPAMLGRLLHFPITSLASGIVGSKVKSPEFKGSIYVGIILGAYLLFMPILIFLFSRIGFWWIALLAPVLGYFSVIFRDQLNLWRSSWRMRGLAGEESRNLSKFRQLLTAGMPSPERNA